MWIVKLALRRPYTFVVMAFLIGILGTAAIITMPVDIFPYIDIPVVSVIWNYSGVSPDEMEKRFVTIYERTLTTTVNDIEHMESTSYSGVSITRIFFQPKARIDMALAQVTAISQTLLRIFPPGTTPPNILKYDASSVPILQLGLGSKTLSEQEIFDLGQNFIRTQLAIVPGASVPLPYGGRFRQVMVDLNPEALYAKQLSAVDVSNAINLQSVILPAGDAKLGDIDYQVKLNSSPRLLEEMNNLPIKVVNGAPIYIKDVGQVRDGYAVQTNIVRTNGTRGALLTVMRNGAASTLDVVNQVKAALPKILAGLTPELKVRELFDQSLFVRAAIKGVLREAIIAAFLTGMMILLFLGSWRSTIIVCISIPLSILTSLAIMSLLGETINVMTLGGLALAVGILVDDATVEIENTHRNLAMEKPLVRAVLDGAMQIAAPAFVSTLSICIVFVPVLLLTGAARYLFTPLAGAVVFAMMASYLLSRTLIPTMVHYMLKPEVKLYATGQHGETEGGQGVFWRVHYLFNRRFEMMRASYTGLLHWSLDHRGLVLTGFGIFVIGSLALIPARRPRFLPHRRFRTDAPARPPARGHARGEERASLRRYRGRNPPRDSRRRDRYHPGQHRHPLRRHQPGVRRQHEHRPRRRRHPGFAQARQPRSHRRIHGPPAQGPAPEVPRCHVLLGSRQHHQPDFEFRHPRADRSAGGGPRRRPPVIASRSSLPAGSRTFRAPPTCIFTRWWTIRKSA